MHCIWVIGKVNPKNNVDHVKGLITMIEFHFELELIAILAKIVEALEGIEATLSDKLGG